MPHFGREPQGYSLPLTPPEYVYGHGSNYDYPQHQQSYYDKRSFEYADYDKYRRDISLLNQPMNFSAQAGFQPPHLSQFQGMPPPGLGHYHSNSMNQSSAIRLPEIAIRKDSFPQFPVPQLIPRPREMPKEEKVVGGVSAHLDYEMDQMADFVHQMVIRVLSPALSNLPAFRKFVSQILSSTRLPSSTILLGLYHLASRPSGLPGVSAYELQDEDVRQLLTMALLLASKFLDDNTFQNKSWAEVTGLVVSDLNKLEASWLMKIGWKLHIRPDQPNGFNSWVELWERFKAGSRPVLASPVEMVVPPALPSPAPYSPYYANHFAQAPMVQERTPVVPHFDSWNYPKLSYEHSPMSIPETGPPTPEYYGVPSWHANSSFSMRTMPPPIQPAPYQQSAYHAPAYAPGFSCWHNVNCLCNSCTRQPELFFPSHYGQQVVS